MSYINFNQSLSQSSWKYQSSPGTLEMPKGLINSTISKQSKVSGLDIRCESAPCMYSIFVLSLVQLSPTFCVRHLRKSPVQNRNYRETAREKWRISLTRKIKCPLTV